MKNPEKPEAQVKAISELKDISVLIANLFEMLPSITRLGIDAFSSPSSPSIIGSSNNEGKENNNNITTKTSESEEKEYDSRYSV